MRRFTGVGRSAARRRCARTATCSAAVYVALQPHTCYFARCAHTCIVPLVPPVHAPVQVHYDDIREVAVNPANPVMVATGAFDHRLCFSFLDASCSTAGHPDVDSTEVGGVVGSLQWFAGANLLSFTLDNGALGVYDCRVGTVVSHVPLPPVRALLRCIHVCGLWRKSPTMCRTQGPFAHHHVTADTILTGFSGGEYGVVDLRAGKLLPQSFLDPAVRSIGQLVRTCCMAFPVWFRFACKSRVALIDRL